MQATRPAPVGTWRVWKVLGMSRDEPSPRPSAPASTSVANPRRTRVLGDVLVTSRGDQDRTGR